MGRLVRIAFAAMAIALLGAALPVGALTAMASTGSSLEAPVVSASSEQDRTVRVEWFAGSDIESIEIVAQDAAGAVSTRTVPAGEGSLVITDVRPGTWSASVTAVTADSRSEAVPVWVDVLGPVPPPAAAPTAAPTPQEVGGAETSEPTESAAPVAVDLAILPGPDGGLDGAQAHVVASGLGAGSAYRLVLAPLGTVLLEGVADPTGAVDVSAVLPSGLAPGDYSLEFTGADGSGAPVTSSYSFDIAGATPAPTVAPDVESTPAEDDGLAAILETEGDEAVPYLVAGAVGATAVAGGAAAAASTLNARARRLRLSRILDAEFPGGGSALPSNGPSSALGSFLDRIRGLR